MNFNNPGFKMIDKKRPAYILELLKILPKLIYTDIDTVWLKDPRTYFIGDYDFWGQIDGVLDGKPYSE